MTATPEHRAIERIKRKATGMAIAAAADDSVAGALDAPGNPTPDSVAAGLARTCRCADAQVMAYRDGAEWWCHTCGYELSAGAARLLTIGARMRHSDRYGRQQWDARANRVA
jgi:hypothetical protein